LLAAKLADEIGFGRSFEDSGGKTQNYGHDNQRNEGEIHHAVI
jgi:hypothetical protein